jgi:hypothetical protein
MRSTARASAGTSGCRGDWLRESQGRDRSRRVRRQGSNASSARALVAAADREGFGARRVRPDLKVHLAEYSIE